MKKYIILASVAAIAAAACTKERVDLPKEPVEISYQVVQKAPVTKADFPDDGKFYSWAYYLGKDKTWDADMNDALPYLSKVEISYDGSKWWNHNDGTGGVHYYWPEEGSLTFFAVSPTTGVSVGCDKATGITVTDLEAGNIDLLVAGIAKDQTSATAGASGVSTVFSHKLTKVQLAAMTVGNDGNSSDYGETFKITDLNWTISNVQYKGSYTQINENGLDKWTKKTDIKDFTYAELAQVTSTKNSSSTIFYMIPQTTGEMNTGAKIEISYTVTMKGSGDNTITYGKTASYALKGDGAPDWGVNKSITYVLKFNGPDEILWDPSIEDWSTTTDTPVVIN